MAVSGACGGEPVEGPPKLPNLGEDCKIGTSAAETALILLCLRRSESYGLERFLRRYTES